MKRSNNDFSTNSVDCCEIMKEESIKEELNAGKRVEDPLAIQQND